MSTVCDNIKTSAGAIVILITTSPYNEVSIILVETLPPRIPNDRLIEYQSWSIKELSTLWPAKPTGNPA